MLIRSVSGVRGLTGIDITPEVARGYGRAFGRMVDGDVVVGWDSRRGGDELVDAVAAGLAECGVAVLDAGVVPTPTVGTAVRLRGLGGGVAVTASHNPPEYNGLKFFSPQGVFLDGPEVERLFRLVDEGAVPDAATPGRTESVDDAVARHIGLVTASSLVDADSVSGAAPTIVVDCVNAAGSVILPTLLRELGANVVELNTETGAGFPRGAEPVPEHLGELAERVVAEGAAAGFACDPDADRLAIVDETGLAIGEEFTLAISTRFVLQELRGPIVANVSTSMMMDDLAEEFGVPIHRTPIGEINVVSKMLEVGAVIGGEGNGGVILPEVHMGRDAATAAAITVSAMAAEPSCSVSALAEKFRPYASVKTKLALSSPTRSGIVSAMTDAFPDGTMDLTDGAKIAWTDRWIHARMSGTEPVVRVIAEATSREIARELVERAVSAVGSAAEGA